MGPSAALVLLNATDVLAPPLNELHSPLLWRYLELSDHLVLFLVAKELELLLDSINVELLKLKLRPVKAFTVNRLSLLNQAAGANVLTLCIFHQTEILLKTGQLTTWKH